MILVVGATGELGRRVVALLRDRGEPVRALVRPATDPAPVAGVGAEIARGDLVDPKSLRAACKGCTTVIATATSISRLLMGAGGPSLREVDELGYASLIAAAEEAGVERFVYVSYARVHMRLGFPLERAKVATEERLRSSSLRPVIVRPDAFQDIHLAPLGRFDVAQGKVSVTGKGDTPVRWVATDDVAALVAAVAMEPDPPPVVELGGPEALSRNRAIEIAEQATGQTMKVQRMPRSVARLAMRVLARPKPALASIFGGGLVVDLVEPRWDDAPLRERGIDPRPASAFIRAQAGGRPSESAAQ